MDPSTTIEQLKHPSMLNIKDHHQDIFLQSKVLFSQCWIAKYLSPSNKKGIDSLGQVFRKL